MLSTATADLSWKTLDFHGCCALFPNEEAAFRMASEWWLLDKTRRCECGSTMTLHENNQEKWAYLNNPAPTPAIDFFILKHGESAWFFVVQ
jgi:hypothetical protein